MATKKLYTGETLAEVILQIKEKNIKLGTVEGGAFFYCGPVENLSDILKTMNIKAKHEHEARLLNTEKALEDAISKIPSAAEYVHKTYKSSKGKKAGDILGYMNFISKEFEKIQNRIDKLQEMRKEKFIPLELRGIKAIYMSVDEDDTCIALIEGREVGRYWTLYEYEHGLGRSEEENDV